MESVPIVDAAYPPDLLTCQAWDTFKENCFAKVRTLRCPSSRTACMDRLPPICHSATDDGYRSQ